MKKVVLFAFAVCLTFASKAQQDLQMTHFMFDKMSFNPGAIGSKDAWCLTAINRQQWTGFDAGEPTTTLINFSTPVLPIIKGALGLTYYNDQVGWETNNVIRLGYSLSLKQLGVNLGNGDLAIGLSAGYNTKTINANWVTPSGIPPNALVGGDGSIPSSNVNDGNLSFNAGLHYATPIWYAGVSTTNISESELQTLKIIGKRHYYGIAGADIPLGFANFNLRPNVLIKSDGVFTQYDFNLNVLAFGVVWAGATIRPNDAIAPMAGVEFKGLQVGYSYGLGTSYLSSLFTNGSHEIMVNYCFKITPPVRYEREVHPYLL